VAAAAQEARTAPVPPPAVQAPPPPVSVAKAATTPAVAPPVAVTKVSNPQPPVGAPPTPVAKPKAETPVAAVPPSAPPKSAVAGDPVRERILSLMVEKTGYPQDMLDVDLDLEADLGVDTVKQAEMFAAIREIYNIPRDENRKLRDYPTLAHVIRFVYEKRPDLAGAAPASSTTAEPTPSGPVTVTAPAVTDNSIKEKVLEIVSEKTGYPKDMLDLDLDLEADLGIDTVKQAEMFASIRAAYNIPRDENLKLREFPTLAHVIQFAHDRQRVAPAATVPTPPASVVATTARPPVASFDAANRIPRRVPVPTLRPPLNLCKPTGVTLGPGCRVIVMPDRGGVASALSERLQTNGVEVFQIGDTRDPAALTDVLKSWLAAGPVQGIYWLPALDDEGPISKLDL